MVMHQFCKLATGVRFPHSAPSFVVDALVVQLAGHTLDKRVIEVQILAGAPDPSSSNGRISGFEPED